jgi:hypothetical protein
VPVVSRNPKNLLAWAALTLILAGLLLWQPRYAGFAVSALLLAALPEEWFFRAYFMMRLGEGWRANIIASLLFALLHGLVWGWMTALLVFLPSLLYGWLYLQTRDIVLLVLLHALSNLFFVLFLADSLATWVKSSPV